MTNGHDGGCDCYVQGSLANGTGTTEAQTALKKRQLHITWEEGLVLPLAEEELPTATLLLTLRTCDRFSRHSVVGELRLGLDGVSVPLGAAQWGELKTSVKVGRPCTGKAEAWSWSVTVAGPGWCSRDELHRSSPGCAWARAHARGSPES